MEVEPGNVIAVPAWMLDAVACSQMRLGDPQVDLQALGELSHLLRALGFRASSQGGVTAAREDANEAQDSSICASPTGNGLGCAGARESDREVASPDGEPARATAAGSEQLGPRGGRR